MTPIQRSLNLIMQLYWICIVLISPVISCHAFITGSGRAADPETISLKNKEKLKENIGLPCLIRSKNKIFHVGANW